MLKKTLLFVLFCAFLFSSFSYFAFADDFTPSDSETSVGAYYLYNYENNMFMAERATDEIIYPSATAKMMTACIALESGVDLQRMISVTGEMLDGVVGRKMHLKAGDKLTFEDLLYATVCGGYNDAATVLALSVSPTLDAFIEKMNEKAAKLGMSATCYKNVTGIDESGMYTCVEDIIKLSNHMISNPEYVKISSTAYYSFSKNSSCGTASVSNRSGMLSLYRGICNLSSGYGTDGYCSVLYYKRGELSFLCIVMNAYSSDTSNTSDIAEYYAKQLIGHALNDYSHKTVLKQGALIDSVGVLYSSLSQNVGVYLGRDLKVYLPSGTDTYTDLSYSTYLYNDRLVAPLKSGDAVGELIVSYDGKVIDTIPLVVAEDIERSGFLYFLDCIKEYVMSRAFLLSCLIFALSLAGYYLYKKRRLKDIHKSSSHYKK